MELILTILIIIVAFISVGVFMRRKIYQRVDALEEKKVYLMNRRVAEELGKIRHLNLSGETEELFESWREEWDEINHQTFGSLEDQLLASEEAAEKYRFRKAFLVLQSAEETLNQVEYTIDEIFAEVERLLHSEQNSREEAKKVNPRIKEVRKKVLENGYQLGKAEVVFEVELDEVEAELARFEELSDEGNYTEAQSLVHDLQARLIEIERKSNDFPELYRACKQSLPEELDHLQNGLREMRDEGFRIQHLGVDKEVNLLHETLLALIEQLNQGNDDGVSEKIAEVESRIKEIYDDLEKEAMDKKYVVEHVPKMDEQLQQAKETFEKTKENVAAVQENYHLNSEKQEKQKELEQLINELDRAAIEIKQTLEDENKPFSTVRTSIEQWFTQYEEWQEPQEAFDHYLHNLRKDELEARDQIAELKHQILVVKQKLHKHNLPGVPNYLVELVNQARELIEQGHENIEEQPLDMDKAAELLNEAEKCVKKAVEQTDLLIEQATLAERVIQYANRYRSQYPILAANIAEAEADFLDYEYERALEKAAQSLEEIEPGALKRIEEFVGAEETSVS
ncbi:septation ring formation regulator EzrA [Allobacillus sp. GCM10007491]|uniref:Septation ring formation regulator EzrA n=1 Tax=Allobacillus saliphilus TaxID=2912308 RepID=A0A941HTY8_9BACI|nr:septation ring formation regulator EzrA [Allobacillus saliphilus]MBR7553779.1 selenide, water dikinase [Allobacillus saliphilus]